MAKTVKIEGATWERIVAAAEAAGYSSPEELVMNAIGKELGRLEGEQSKELLARQLRGLGYIE